MARRDALERDAEKEKRREQRREERRAERRAARRAERRAARELQAVVYADDDPNRPPSKPSGRWTEEERKTGWLLSRSRQWSRTGRVKIDDKEAFLARGAQYLDHWKWRAAHETIPTAEKKQFMQSLYALATKHGHVCGKWMVFAPVNVVDALWEDIDKANNEGQLGGCCKVCTFNRASETHLICVYCRDFNDAADCQRVLYALHNICAPYGVRIIANFKADFLTALGVYKSRSANIACSYTLKELKLIKEWPERRLKRVLDNLKRKVRELEEKRDRAEAAALTASRRSSKTRR